jgi:hypothetical protein
MKRVHEVIALCLDEQKSPPGGRPHPRKSCVSQTRRRQNHHRSNSFW